MNTKKIVDKALFTKSKPKKKVPLKKKALIFLILIIITPLLIISMITYFAVSNVTLEKIAYSSVQGFNQSLSFMEYKIYRAIKMSDVVVTDNTIQKVLQDLSSNSLPEQINSLQSLRRGLQSIEDINDGMSLSLYIDDEYIISQDKDYLHPLSVAEKSAWYAFSKKDNIYFSPGQYMSNTEKVALIRNLASTNNYNDRLAILRLDIDISSIKNILSNAASTTNTLAYIENSDGVLVASSNNEILARYNNQIVFENTSDSSIYGLSGLFSAKVNGQKIHYIQSKIENTDWTMTAVIPMEDIMLEINSSQLIILVLLIILGGIAFLVGHIAISSIVRSLNTLAVGMQKVQEGNLDIQLKKVRNDEIGMLYDSYNSMVIQTKYLLKETYEMGIELKNAELKALQSQINPHFLYNTLEMINWMGYNNQTEDIRKTVFALAKFYKLSLNKGKYTQTIEQELLHTMCYIEIQNLRFAGAIKIEVDVSKPLMQQLIPKITLQPLIENALIHGILETKSKTGTIKISGYEKKGKATIKVFDDGVGMPSETLVDILIDSEKSEKEDSGYGVKNIDARLRLMFGDKCGLNYKSSLGKGTEVSFSFPFD